MGKSASKPSNKPSSGDDILTGTGGFDTIHGLAGNDQISGGANQDRLYGDDGNDALNGDDGNDFLFGGTGNDTLSGGTGNDDLRGEEGSDALVGGIGNDALNGGAGLDVMTGGSGADHFDYLAFSDSVGATADRITDYSLAAGDDLVFAALDANADVDGLQAWNYVDRLGDYNGDNGQATLSYDSTSNTTTLNLYNNDGNQDADFTVTFTGHFEAGEIQITVLDMLGGDPNIHGIIW